MKKTKQILITVAVCLAAVEVVLRFTGVFKVGSEKNGRGYVSSYGEVHPTWYITHAANDTFVPNNTDFHYQYITNKIGIRERNFSEYKSDSVYRILITGNSYVEGVGAPYDSTWPRLIEKELRGRNMKVEVIDAGIAGSDIIYDYVLYRDILKSYHPDLIVATMNPFDYVYYTFRGGVERFHADGTVRYLPIPWYDFLYHYSHLFRAILATIQYPVRGAYLSKNSYKTVSDRATLEFASVIKKYRDEASSNKARFVCIFFPKGREVKNMFFTRNSTKNFNDLSRALSNDSITNFNLLLAVRNKLSDLPESVYTYPHDWHYTPTGYLVLARLTTDSLLASQILKP